MLSGSLSTHSASVGSSNSAPDCEKCGEACYHSGCRAHANGGAFDGKRLLSPRTVDLMATNHVGDLFRGTGGRSQGMGFGLTVDVVLDHAAAGRRASNGTFAWGGAFGTYFWVDRKEAVVGVLMVQTPVDTLRTDFQNAVMQAIIE